MKTMSPGKRDRGFTVIEMLITLTLFGIVVAVGLPSLQKLILRNKLESVTRSTATVFSVARYEAIKIGVPTVVRIIPATSTVQAFVDDDGNGERDPGERILRSYELPGFIEFGGPRSEAPPISLAVKDFTAGPAGKPNQLVFDTNGAARDTGAFRVRERKLNNPDKENYLEIEVPVLAAQSFRVRKWDPVLTKWTEQGEDNKPWDWKM